MRCAYPIALAIVLVACGPGQIQNRTTAPSDLTKHLPAALEVERPREGEPRVVKVRVWVDAAARAQAKWREEISDQIDYANQLLTPLVGVRLTIDAIKDWDRTSDPHAALQALAAIDKGEGVVWVIGYITPGDVASKAVGELAFAEPLGRHVIVRAWAELQETEALARRLPDLKEGDRVELVGAHRRHKQTVALLHALAASLGAIDEADPAWIQHPTYSHKQTGLSERNRELLTLAIDARIAEQTDAELAKRLVEAIEKSPWGGWIPTSHEQVVNRLRGVLDAARSGKTAADVPPAAYDQYSRIQVLAKRGATEDALAELDNLLMAYPGNAAMYLLRCEIFLNAQSKKPAADKKTEPKYGVAAKATRTTCARASELAPGDPSPHLAVGEALARTNDFKAARAELAQAEGKIGNLPSNRAEAWKRLIAIYQAMGSLTWTEDAIARAKLGDKDPIAIKAAQTRARYGLPRGTRIAPEDEGALVAAVRDAIDLVYKGKYGPAEQAIAKAEKRWPGVPGLAGARCELGFRMGQIDAARASCNKALDADPNASWALYLSAVILLRDASGSAAGIERLKKAIAIDPELGQAWRTLGKAYAQRTNDKPALEQLRKDYLAKFGTPLPP
jgi:tetratricopeptide (TPR) repeat protein